MRELDYRKIDAFTSGNSLGNPAACIYLKPEQTLSGAEMLDIARQHKGFVSEVVYCVPKPNDEYELAYYSSECEVDFCGYGTIACMYGLISETPELHNQKEITIHTNKKGTLTVYNELPKQDAVYITAPEPLNIGCEIGLPEIAENLALETWQIERSRPVDVIDAGLRTLIVPLVSMNDVINALPKEPTLKEFCLKSGIDIVLIYSLECADKQSIAHTRVFAPKFGYLEDPATGSGNSAFGYYMLKSSIWDGTAATIEQGGADRVYNSVRLLCRENRILFGGKAATRIKGTYYL